MATVYDHYVINIFYNDTRIDEISPEEFSFVISDSIYNLYPSGIFSIHDLASYFQEGLATVPGAKVRIEYGDKENLNKCEFVVQQDELPEAEHHTILRGNVEIPLIHSWYNDQQITNKGYQDKISNIIDEITNEYSFEDKDIESTENNDYWLQCLQSNASFIKNTLLPNCFSINSNNTPFFAYITTDNIFHLRSFHSMTIKNTVATIAYKAQFLQKEQNEIEMRNRISSLKRWRENLKTVWNYKNRKIFKIDREDGTLQIEDDSITDHPSKGGFLIPIMNDHGNATGYANLQFTESETGRKQNLKGQSIHYLRDSLFVDYFQIILPFNPVMHSGDLVDMSIYLPENDASKLSQNFSGKYVIVNCEHSWNKEDLTGYTNLIVGRKYVQLPDAYFLKGKLIS